MRFWIIMTPAYEPAPATRRCLLSARSASILIHMGGQHEPWNLNIHHDQLLARLAPPGSRVLDVGCGDGFLAARMQANGCRVVAIDVDAGALERARRRWTGRDIEWVQADLLTYDPPGNEFDAVVSNAAIHHVERRRPRSCPVATFVVYGSVATSSSGRAPPTGEVGRQPHHK